MKNIIFAFHDSDANRLFFFNAAKVQKKAKENQTLPHSLSTTNRSVTMIPIYRDCKLQTAPSLLIPKKTVAILYK